MSRTTKPVSLVIASLMTIVGGFLDAYTFMSYGVFATAQTGNVVLLMTSGARGEDAGPFLWPILSFITAVTLAKIITTTPPKTEKTAIVFTLAAEACALAFVGFLPVHIDPSFVTVLIAAFGGLQFGLFRAVGEIAFVSIATTGNLRRLMEATVDLVRKPTLERSRHAGTAFAIVTAFALGALIGGLVTAIVGAHAVWAAALTQVVILFLFLYETRAPTATDVRNESVTTA